MYSILTNDPDELNKLDLNSPEVAKSILFYDKHTLLEGKISENLFDQILKEMTKKNPLQIHELDCEVVITKDRENKKWYSFIWARSESSDILQLGNLLNNFSECMILYFNNSDKKFYCSEIKDYINNQGDNSLLIDYLNNNFKKRHTIKPVQEVRDLTRQQETFWGFLNNCYGKDLGEKVVRPRILINFIIQCFFQDLWDLDRIYKINEDYWTMEIKHKYPFGRNQLFFGLNDGEVELYRTLAGANIKCLHTIFVKPLWKKDAGSMYLLNNLQAKNKCAIVSKLLNKEYITKLSGKGSNIAPSHTSIDGRSQLRYKSIPNSDFMWAGNLGNRPDFTAQKIYEITQNNGINSKDNWLIQLREEFAQH